MVREPSIAFGDRVRVCKAPETTALGIAGLEGDLYGFTTPSVTGVVVVGDAPDDYALYVFFRERKEGFWFRPDLLELLHHNPGSVATIKGSPARYVRQSDGTWVNSTGCEDRGLGATLLSVLRDTVRLRRLCRWKRKDTATAVASAARAMEEQWL
jgi:hypothetical protein